MIEELRLLQEIVGDLSAIGGWVAGGYILYKVVTTLVLYVGGGYLFKYVVTKIYDHLRADITREEADKLREDLADAHARTVTRVAEEKAETARHKAEAERVKHLYKILKEKNEAQESESL